MPSIDHIINRQFKQWEADQRQRREDKKAESSDAGPLPIITVARQHGSRGAFFAQRLAEDLGYQHLHREVIDAICQSSGYRKHIVEALDEKYRSSITMVVESILTGQAFHHTDYSRNLCTVILSMAKLGGVVLVGRGGSFILGPRIGFHIRVVCPVEQRIENLVKYRSMSRNEAAKSVTETDAMRKEMIRKMFDADIDNPIHYDLVFNSAIIDVEDMVQSTVLAMQAKKKMLSARVSPAAT